MNTKHFISRMGIIAILVVLVLGFTSGSASATSAGTAFTYQGQLTEGGNVVTGSCDFQFGLWDALSGGSQVTGTTTLTLTGVTVTNGLFTVQLDFGADAFTGSARWLKIAVKCGSETLFTTLAPRQELTPAPYALYAPAAGNATTVTDGVYTTGSYADPAWLTSLAGSKISGAVANAMDADTVDGQHASAFAATNHSHWGDGWTGTGIGLSLSGGLTGLYANGSDFGLDGESDAVDGKGVFGYATATTGSSDGVYGRSNSANGSGVTGINMGDGWGVFGWATGTTNPGVGGLGAGIGVMGYATYMTGVTYGVIGTVDSPDGYAGNFHSTAGNGVTINVPSDKIGLNVASGLAQVAGNTIWHAGNDGSGSGLDADLLDGLHSASFWKLDGNFGTNPLTNFLGTLDNTALELRVNYSRALRIEPNATSPNLIGGYSGNSVTAGVVGAGIGGGGESGYTNRVTDSFGVVAGGLNNVAGDNTGTTLDRTSATVCGGSDNIASGTLSTVGGGSGNHATGASATVGGGDINTSGGEDATVGGGGNNHATGPEATISGGENNTASNVDATVSGGSNNTASGAYSAVPGGWSAKATHYGEMAHASGDIGRVGDAQASEYVLRRVTTDAGTNELFLDGSYASQRITLANQRALSFDILIIAETDAPKFAGYEIKGVIRNWGGTTAFVGSPTITVLGEDVAIWDAWVEADNINDALVVRVLGEAGTAIDWVASVRTVEVNW